MNTWGIFITGSHACTVIRITRTEQWV